MTLLEKITNLHKSFAVFEQNKINWRGLTQIFLFFSKKITTIKYPKGFSFRKWVFMLLHINTLGLKACITSSFLLIWLLVLACLLSLFLPPVPGTGRWLTKKKVLGQRRFFHLRLSPKPFLSIFTHECLLFTPFCKRLYITCVIVWSCLEPKGLDGLF